MDWIIIIIGCISFAVGYTICCIRLHKIYKKRLRKKKADLAYLKHMERNYHRLCQALVDDNPAVVQEFVEYYKICREQDRLMWFGSPTDIAAYKESLGIVEQIKDKEK